jgi:two-component system CheB/CheR fusion protein
VGDALVISIELPLAEPSITTNASVIERSMRAAAARDTILIIEDDLGVSESFNMLFSNLGYQTAVASDSVEAISLVQRGFSPSIIVADQNLSGGKTGLQTIADVRHACEKMIPSIVLTGDTTPKLMRDVIATDCSYLQKPATAEQLIRRVRELITAAALPDDEIVPPANLDKSKLTVFIVDDDSALLSSLQDFLPTQGYKVEAYADADAFLSSYDSSRKGCLLVDGLMPAMSGLDLLKHLKHKNISIPAIFMTGYGDMKMAVAAMKAGALDFIEKSAKPDVLLASIDRALAHAGDIADVDGERRNASKKLSTLTPREREVLNLVVEGLPNKQIAFRLNISQRTVETHRAAVMKRTAAASLPDLIRVVMTARSARL